MSDATLAGELEALAERIARIRPIGNNGDATPFYEDRSEVARDARSLAEWQRKGRMPAGYVPAAARQDDRKRTSYVRR